MGVCLQAFLIGFIILEILRIKCSGLRATTCYLGLGKKNEISLVKLKVRLPTVHRILLGTLPTNVVILVLID